MASLGGSGRRCEMAFSQLAGLAAKPSALNVCCFIGNDIRSGLGGRMMSWLMNDFCEARFRKFSIECLPNRTPERRMNFVAQ